MHASFTATRRFTRILSVALALPLVLAGCIGAQDSGEDVSNQDDSIVSENGNDKIAFEFFVKKGLTDVQAAGIVGNLDQESGMSPTIWQYGGGPGRGIAQWSAGGRWDSDYHDNVVWYANTHKASRYSLDLQLEFIWYELTSFGFGYSKLRAAKTVSEATVAFQDDYEICGACDSSNRIAHAKAALAAFAHAEPPPSHPPLPADCDVHADHKLYCKNTPDVAMHAQENYGSAVVNRLRSSTSWFTCWGTGELHAGGNHTWYYTLGDDNSHWGWVPAVNLVTPSSFDANPSAYGLPHCK